MINETRKPPAARKQQMPKQLIHPYDEGRSGGGGGVTAVVS